MIPGSDVELGALIGAAWSVAGLVEDPDAQMVWMSDTRRSSLSLRQGCLLSEPEAGEGCPLEAEDPLVGREGDHFVGGAEDP